MELLAPLDREAEPDLAEVFSTEEERRGFVPTPYLALARNPAVVRSIATVFHRGLRSGTLHQQHRHLLFAAAAATSRSCYTFGLGGLALEECGFDGRMLVEALEDIEGTPLLDDRTRVSVAMARDMASIPNNVRPRHFEDLRQYYDEDEIVEIAFIVALHGLVHRVTGMLGSVLEVGPRAWAERTLGRDLILPTVSPATDPTIAERGGTRLAPLDQTTVPDLAREFTRFADTHVPNSFLVMARRPDLVRVMLDLVSQLLATRSVPHGLAYMASWLSSYATGCMYCQAHTSLHASNSGVSPEKIDDLWTFETSPLFTATERVALRLALAGACQPSAMSDELVMQLHEYFDDRTIADLVVSIASFGFYNRWNDTFVTPLEDQPFEFAATHLRASGWDPQKHRPTARSS